ncbi:hypothetical protein ACIP5Y_42645 [Nocardia sp. NPDC088792]|uniref:hypothetical protein n=1 Tax=Nocardia sp. NPDC088792 TaxID=3364332 RepID=UPI00380A2315
MKLRRDGGLVAATQQKIQQLGPSSTTEHSETAESLKSFRISRTTRRPDRIPVYPDHFGTQLIVRPRYARLRLLATLFMMIRTARTAGVAIIPALTAAPPVCRSIFGGPVQAIVSLPRRQ